MRRGPALLVAAVLAMVAAQADAADCRDRDFQWSDTQPPVNLRHVFCGDLDNGRPKGMHSSRLVASSPVVRGIERSREEGGGVFSATVRFANGRSKLSTFFPHHCTFDQVVRSIVYAADHPIGRHRAWGELGPSAPEANATGYCVDDRGAPLILRFGRNGAGGINTAFPN